MAPPPQCSYCSRHRLSGRRSYLHPQFTAQLVGACSYWHLGTEHVFLWPCAYYSYFLRLKFLTTMFLTGDAVCIPVQGSTTVRGYNNKYQCDLVSYTQLRSPRSHWHRHTLRGQFVLHSEHSTAHYIRCCYRSMLEVCVTTQWAYR